MDNLTHSLVGALIGQAGLKRKTGLAMPALVIGANLPDVDVSCLFWLEGMEHLAFRRGITHGPPAWFLLPLALSALLYGWDRWQARRGTRPEGRLPVRFGWLYLLSFIACLSHPALDWMNVYGVRLLEPFSSRWFYGDVLFIIDIWLWLGLGFATWLSLRREKKTGGNWRSPARIALVAALAYVGVNWHISAGASAVFGINNKAPGRMDVETVIASPVVARPWRRDLIVGTPNNWSVGASDEFSGYAPPERLTERGCQWPDVESLRRSNSGLDAFLFWSRTPYAERAEDGDYVVLRDARYAGRSTFEVRLPEVPCLEITPD